MRKTSGTTNYNILRELWTYRTDSSQTRDNTEGTIMYISLRDGNWSEWIRQTNGGHRIIKKITHPKCDCASHATKTTDNDGTIRLLVGDYGKEEDINGDQSH